MSWVAPTQRLLYATPVRYILLFFLSVTNYSDCVQIFMTCLRVATCILSNTMKINLPGVYILRTHFRLNGRLINVFEILLQRHQTMRHEHRCATCKKSMNNKKRSNLAIPSLNTSVDLIVHYTKPEMCGG